MDNESTSAEQTWREVVVEAGGTGIGRWLQQRLHPGDVFVDVGANVGKFVALAADLVGPTGKVVAFEPGPDNLATLRRRFEGRAHVRVIDAAVAAQSGRVTLHLDKKNGTHHSLQSRNVATLGEPISVAVVTLDAELSNSHVHVVKIDAQGADLDVLRGARETLARCRPFITIEFWPAGIQNMGADPTELLDELKSAGYDLFRLSAKGQLKPESHIREFVPSSRWSSINVAAHPRRPMVR